MRHRSKISSYSHVDLKPSVSCTLIILIVFELSAAHNGSIIVNSSDLRNDTEDFVGVYFDSDESVGYFDAKNGQQYNLISSDSQIRRVFFSHLDKGDAKRSFNQTHPQTPQPSTDGPNDALKNVARHSRLGDSIFCGEANTNGKSTNEHRLKNRIVGGSKTEPGEFPFQVRLNIRSRRGSGICGGVLIGKQHLLTAAHCVTACLGQSTITLNQTNVNVTLGDHSIKSNDGELEVELETIQAHELYDACNFATNNHDIAMIKLARAVDYVFTIDGYGSINRPCMPKSPFTNYKGGEHVIVSGWGVVGENQRQLSNILRYVQVEIVNIESCQRVYYGRVTEMGHVCAGVQFGGKDSCQGDSGGPLVRITEDNRYELVGIVSFGYGCAQAGAPGVYTRVANYLDWIKSKSM